MPVIGQCRLCLVRGSELQSSHYLPRAIYEIGASSSREPNPVIAAGSKALVTSKQVWDRLLCLECEGRFNANGEGWFVRNCWQKAGDFPLLAALRRAIPIPGFIAPLRYDARALADVDMAKLVYFGMSVFWRGAAHDWKALEVPVRRVRLGPYEEQIRSYLLGGPFPANAVVVVAVNSDPDHLSNGLAFPPVPTDQVLPGLHCYRLAVCGVAFHLALGKTLSPGIREQWAVGAGVVLLSPDVGKASEDAAWKLFGGAEMLGKKLAHLRRR